MSAYQLEAQQLSVDIDFR